MSEQQPLPPRVTARQKFRHPLHTLATSFPEQRIGRTARRLERKIEQRRARWEQFQEDYVVGGGIREGLKQAFNWGALAGVLGGMAGGVGGGILDVVVASLNAGPDNPGAPPALDPIVIPDSPIGDLYILMPLVLAAIGVVALGGYVFYKGLMSPAREGRRMREGRWDTYWS